MLVTTETLETKVQTIGKMISYEGGNALLYAGK